MRRETIEVLNRNHPIEHGLTEQRGDRRAWILPRATVLKIRQLAPGWKVKESVAKAKTQCRDCGGPIQKGEARLTFLLSGKKGERFQRWSHIHARDCSTPVPTVPEIECSDITL